MTTDMSDPEAVRILDQLQPEHRHAFIDWLKDDPELMPILEHGDEDDHDWLVKEYKRAHNIEASAPSSFFQTKEDYLKWIENWILSSDTFTSSDRW